MVLEMKAKKRPNSLCPAFEAARGVALPKESKTEYLDRIPRAMLKTPKAWATVLFM